MGRSENQMTALASYWQRTFYMVFSAPEPKAQVHYCDHTLSVVRRPSVVNFHIFNFSSETAKQNSTKLVSK